MNEADWLAGAHPRPMWQYVDGKVSERKLRLFSCACWRRVSDRIGNEWSKRTVELLEMVAEGLVTATDAERRMRDIDPIPGRHRGDWRGIPAAIAGAVTKLGGSREAEERCQCDLLRDIVGNPFRRVAFNSAWLTSNVVGLAASIYDERAFDRLPVLADALLDAGCTDEDILGHCRSGGPHVLGCWVVDLLLGKG